MVPCRNELREGKNWSDGGLGAGRELEKTESA